MGWKFSWTVDGDLIRSAVLSPHNRPWAAPDGFDVDLWEPLPSPWCRFVRVDLDGVFQGIITLLGGSALLEAHISLLPCTYGHTQSLGNAALGWVFLHTGAHVILAPCAADNRLASNFLEGLGFEVTSVKPGAWTKGGTTTDMNIYKLKRGY